MGEGQALFQVLAMQCNGGLVDLSPGRLRKGHDQVVKDDRRVLVPRN